MRRRRLHHLDDRAFTDARHLALLTICTAERADLLVGPAVSAVVASALATLHDDGWRALAYCVMPDHVHALVVTPLRPPSAFAQAFKAITTRVVRRQGIAGVVWQRGYHDRIVRRAEGIADTIRYVLANPVRRGLVRSWREWPSSGSLVWSDREALVDALARPESILWAQALESAM